MSGGINAHWLMHYRVVTLVNQCRRLIRDEFGVKLTLTDPRLREALSEYAGRSGSTELKRLIRQIDEEAGDAMPEDEPGHGSTEQRPARRMYRGQPLPDPPADAGASSESGPEKTIIYRGRRVRGG
ncbi:hypothetical protein [Alloalcanivorax marinus]|uniref:hypothetical protein n=1 Tax=Alloalcanivorax marinus TaxID=1177169 RepID=UPI0021CFCEEC|nr:hypothetical protein [Alloalcanivorax marinus]MCU5785483.1 hypothetical protein [Alloalcanivorax marinus]